VWVKAAGGFFGEIFNTSPKAKGESDETGFNEQDLL
jgi:hypothetical protein